MNGAESLVATLVEGNVDVCFANPGTSEMHFVAALDKVVGMKTVLGLFEGVCTGAADGYFRIARKPACTLLHLGPGLANGLANLHNAKKANSGVINIVGEHATQHIALDAPLTADIEGIAEPVSHFVVTPMQIDRVGDTAALAIARASGIPHQIATLILPANMAWSTGGITGQPQIFSDFKPLDERQIERAATILNTKSNTLLLLGGNALSSDTLVRAGKIAKKTNCKLLTEWSNARLDRGAGRIEINRIPYVVEKAVKTLQEFKHIILVGSREPVAFFAYPDKPGKLASPKCEFITISNFEQNADAALAALEEMVGAKDKIPHGISRRLKPPIPTGKITPEGIASVLGALLPEGAIIVDESVSTGRDFFRCTAGAPPHIWLNNRGGSIGYGLPVALGAAIASPNQKVIVLESDGSGMYTPQTMWTIARENLDVTILVFSNRSYNILFGELKNVGVTAPGPQANSLFSLNQPDLDWVLMSKGMGIDASKVSDMSSLTSVFSFAMQQKSPYLIEIEL